MAISFIGSSEQSAASGSGPLLSYPASIANDDLLIVAYAVGDNDGVDFTMDLNPNTSWTKVADLFADDTQDCNLGVWWKIYTGSDSNVFGVNLGGADAANAMVCMAFRGVDTTTPMDVTPTTATGINTMHPNPPSIDHNNPSGVWTVAVGASGHTLGGAGTYTFPTGYTTNAIDRGQDDTSDVTVGMGYRSSGVSDPEDPGVMTHSGSDSTSFAWCAVTLALRPAVVAASTYPGWDGGGWW